MAEFLTRSSRMAIVLEVTDGTPVEPTLASDYVALQPDFTFSPSFDNILNEELKGLIEESETLQGLENNAAAISHYLRGSGVEGTEVDYGLLIESLLGGKRSPTERDTVGGSTVSIIEVDTGEGATDFAVGQSLLVKKGTGVGFEVRPVEAISGDSLTMGFNLTDAPATGVDLGAPINYFGANDTPTFTSTLYRGNGASKETISGSRTLGLDISSAAAEIVNGAFTWEGSKFFYDSIEITSSNFSMDFDDGLGEENVSIEQKMYRSPIALAAEIEAKMNAATLDTITVTWNSSGANIGKFTLSSSGGTFSLLFATGVNTATTIAPKIGFDTVDETGSTSYDSDSVQDWSSPQEPTFDDEDPLIVKKNILFIGNATDNLCIEAATVDMTIAVEKIDKLSVCSDTGKTGVVPSNRAFGVTISTILVQHDVDKFNSFLNNSDVQFFYVTGRKDDADDWVPGSVVTYYGRTCKIQQHETTDFLDGLSGLNLELKPFSKDGQPSFHINTI